MKFIGKHQLLCILFLVTLVLVSGVTILYADNNQTQVIYKLDTVTLMLITLVQGLVSFIYLSGRKTDRELLMAELKALRNELNGLGGRVDCTESNISKLFGHLDEIHQTYLSKDDHDRICKVAK